MADILFSNTDNAPTPGKLAKETIVERLRKIRWMDKYHAFHKAVPGVKHTPDHMQDTINNIVEDCCTELIRHYLAKKAPTVTTVRNIILKYMDMVSYADVNNESKDFGYELCWYIAEKTGISIKKYTDTKVYGYWKIEDNQLKQVTKRGKKKATAK